MLKFTLSNWKVSLILFFLGLAIRLHLSRDFDGLYGQDSFAYYNYAVAFQQGEIPNEMYWPAGFPLMLAAGFSLFGESAEVAQVIVIFFGALTGSFTFLLVYNVLSLIHFRDKTEGGLRARQLRYGNSDSYTAPLEPAPTNPAGTRYIASASLTAALLVIFSGQLLQSSVVVMADIPALFLAIFSAWCLVRYALYQKSPWLILASVTLAVAGITRWNYLLLVLPWGIFYLLTLPCGFRRTRYIASLPKIYSCIKDLCFALFFGLLILLPQLALSQQTPASLGEHSWLQHWSPGNATKKDFVNPDGTFHYEKSIVHFYTSASWDSYYIHPIFLPFMGIGILSLVWKIRQSAPALILFAGWFLVEYGFLIGIPYQNIRFSMAFFLPLAVFSGIGIAAVIEMLNKTLRTAYMPSLQVGTGRDRIYPVRILMILALAITTFSAYTTFTAGKAEIDRFIQRKNADLNTVKWVQETIPESEADIYTLDLWLMMQHYAPELEVHQIYYETPESLTKRLPSEKPTYLLLNLWAIENQWVGKAPWTAYHWLEDNTGLTSLGRYGNYTLLQVENHESG